ncbi:MAG: D-alanyl-D-alanine carboxypeptidase/D-alanyl-D-alanine-endopeptidase, partial [Polyangiales bacterium]
MRITPLALLLTLSIRTALAHAQAPVPVATPKPQADSAEAALAAKLAALVEKSGLGGGMGAVVADATTGKRLYTLNPEVPRNPASNMKLLTAATALTELGPEFRLRTSVLGAPDPHGHVPVLVVRGEGDPSLSYADLLGIARRLVDAGVREVGEIVVDGSAFDNQVLPPAFEQQPKEIAAFRAAVAAVSVDRSAYTLRLVPGAEVGAPAQVSLHCPDHFVVDAQLTTSASGAPKVSAEQTPRGDKLSLTVRGAVPIGVRGVGYERRVESPLAYAGDCVRAALRTQGIGGAQAVRLGKTDDAPPLLATHESAPLSVLLQRVGKYSDNFVAEMLLKVIGARTSGAPGSSAAGVGGGGRRRRPRAVAGRAGGGGGLVGVGVWGRGGGARRRA